MLHSSPSVMYIYTYIRTVYTYLPTVTESLHSCRYVYKPFQCFNLARILGPKPRPITGNLGLVQQFDVRFLLSSYSWCSQKCCLFSWQMTRLLPHRHPSYPCMLYAVNNSLIGMARSGRWSLISERHYYITIIISSIAKYKLL